MLIGTLELTNPALCLWVPSPVALGLGLRPGSHCREQHEKGGKGVQQATLHSKTVFWFLSFLHKAGIVTLALWDKTE